MENVKIKPLGFFLIPTGTYGQQVYKPYRTNSDDRLIGQLFEDTKGGTDLSPNAVAKIAGSLIAPSNKSAGNADIIYGWDHKRFRFVLSMEVTVNQDVYIQVATGYTDHQGVSGTNIDENMKLFFNSIQAFTRSFQMTKKGMEPILIPYDHNQLIKPETTQMASMMGMNFNHDHMGLNTEQRLLRPQDVFNKLTFHMLLDGYNYPGNTVANASEIYKKSDMEDPTVTKDDSRTLNSGSVKTSNRRNGNSSTYVSTVLSAFKKAKLGSKENNEYNIVSNAASDESLQDKYLYDNMVIYKFSKIFRDYPKRGYITYKHMKILMPDLNHVTKIFTLSKVKKIRPLANHTTVESTANMTAEAHASTILSNALPNLMIDSLLSQVSFFASNNYIDGKIKFTWSDDDGARSIIKGITPYIDKFMFRLTNEILYGICHQGAVRFNLTIFADIHSDIQISIGFGTNPPEPYNVPIFCDSIFSPVIGNSKDDLSKLSSDMLKLASNICR